MSSKLTIWYRGLVGLSISHNPYGTALANLIKIHILTDTSFTGLKIYFLPK